MRSVLLCLAAMAANAPAYTQTSPPTAPSVTAGAEFKGLRFDWDAVARAAWYQLEYRAHQAGPFVQLGANYAASTTSIRLRLPLHLFDWTYARYRIAACNSSGCTRSNEVPVSDLRRDAAGYFKQADPRASHRFGADTDISPDGLNFVAAAPGEYIDDAGGNSTPAGAVYVFRRAASGTWAQRARLEPTFPPFIEGSTEMSVGISADGNTVVVGMPNYFHEQFDELSGEVQVFRFNGTAWTRTRLYSSLRGMFGRWVSINDAGDTIAVASGDNIETNTPRRVFIYRLTSGAWQPVRGIADLAGEGCVTGDLSGDGATLAEQCARGPAPARRYVRTHSGANWSVRTEIPLEMAVASDFGYAGSGIGISADGATIAAQIYKAYGPNPNMGPAEVQVFRLDGAWSKVATLTPGAWRVDAQENFYGLSVAVSGDGGTIAVGDSWDNGFGTGPRAAPLNPDPTRRSGAVYVYRLKNNWVLANMVKPNVAATSPSTWGHEVELNDNGQTMIVGFSTDGSNASGIGGDWDNYDGGATGSGAVFMY
jgi:hypothetical protein